MRIGIVSDIHGNLHALEAVLESMDEQRAEQMLCAGDIVGYGANPRECLKLVWESAEAAVGGNHESGVLCEGASTFFNRVAREACA